MEHFFHSRKVLRDGRIHSLISKINNPQKRNLLRGHAAKSIITPSEIESIRKGCSFRDILLIGAILNGPYGLLNTNKPYKKNIKKTSADLFSLTSITPLDWKMEAAYTAGFINESLEYAIECLNFIYSLSLLEKLETDEALNILFNISKKYGASNFLSYKLAYLRTARDIDTLAPALEKITQIEDEICHRANVGFHFSALENISPKLSLFQVAQRRVSALVGRVTGDIRKSITLSNFIPTPLDVSDSAGFLLRATESCLLDTVYSVLVIFNLSTELGVVRQQLERHLNKQFVEVLLTTINDISKNTENDILTDHYKTQNEENINTLDLYRTSAAFLERPQLALYRHNIDRVIGARLLAEIYEGEPNVFTPALYGKNILLMKNGSAQNEKIPVLMDHFYRTYQFLRFISDRMNLIYITKDDIKYIFENTMELEMLLTEDEMRSLYDTAPTESKSLVAVLALALFRKKSVDPDIDFDFRSDFIHHVNSSHGGSIIDFISYLLNDTPQIASYIVSSLDEVTLEKMYTLVKNSSQASSIRCEILRIVGQKLKRIEYIIEADAIMTRSKVAKLQQYFDSSRMYVDSVSMKKWLDSNPTISTEQYRSVFPNIEARNESGILIVQINDHSEYLISQIAKDAFEQFCLNTEFGIQSYLGRRIRHNTLDGVTTDTVDAVIRKPDYRSIMTNQIMRRTVEAWIVSYKAIIDKLRKDYLQFKPSGSLFNATIDTNNPTTKENIKKLSNTLKTAGTSELLNDLIIAFCWHQISPQLENAARFIKTTLLKEANASIEKSFTGYTALEGQLKAELHEAINEVFRKVADWFQVPQTGFISASVRDLCQIILIELNRATTEVDFSGEAVDIRYTGISVHRLYDCLAVLLQNAHKHGEENTSIKVDVSTAIKSLDSMLEKISVDILSTVSKDKYELSKQRILNAIDSAAGGTDMVTEGYSGIKKVKVITRTSENSHTIRCDANDDTRQLKIGFSIHMETTQKKENNGGSV